MKKVLEKSKNVMLKIALMVSAYSVSVIPMMAKNNLTITGKFTTAAGKLLSDLEKIYCGSVAWLLLVINILVLAFSKDDKVIGIAKRSLATIVIAYIAIKILAKANGGVIGNAIDTMAGWF